MTDWTLVAYLPLAYVLLAMINLFYRNLKRPKWWRSGLGWAKLSLILFVVFIALGRVPWGVFGWLKHHQSELAEAVLHVSTITWPISNFGMLIMAIAAVFFLDETKFRYFHLVSLVSLTLISFAFL